MAAGLMASAAGTTDAVWRAETRGSLPFGSVNRRHTAAFDPGLQRHHLLPRQLLSRRCFGAMFDTLGQERTGFDDFRRNGLLLPSHDAAAVRLGLPLHRGPHGAYNSLVIERVGHVEQGWARRRWRAPERAVEEALMRLDLLQRALRRRLLAGGRRRFALNRLDPLRHQVDFTELDSLVDQLWPATDPVPDIQAEANPALAASSSFAD
jgi:hypothetical protein